VAHVEAMRRQPKAEAPMMAEVSVAQAQAPLEGSTATASAESAEA